MANENFIDYVKICFRSGSGGSGSVHFYRAKYIPKGGPDGGDGGRGGHIILRGNRNVWTLLPLKYRKHVYAGNGNPGGLNNRTGADGEDVILEVPLGTVARSDDGSTIFGEITTHEQELVLLPGGRGGKGNSHFKTSVNQTPRYAQPGEDGIESWVVLELKILADVGLVGFPNAGKSTLLASLSAAKPEIADYPFTTLVPNLGVVSYRDAHSFIMADIPGIIEGAHEGKGLGHRFLRHIERNATLLFTIPCDSDDIVKDYKILLRELQAYNPELLDKPRILAITKCDIIDEDYIKLIDKDISSIDVSKVYVSGVSGFGLMELKDVLWPFIDRNRTLIAMEEEEKDLF
jgi:GTP-binding protein